MISKTATNVTATATASASGGTSFVGLLTIAFIVLKLTHVIDWPLVWVLSPIWITALLFVAFIIIFIVCFLIYYFFHKRAEKRRYAAYRARVSARQNRNNRQGW